jgi:hypothetical protein
LKIIKLLPKTLALTGLIGVILFYSCTDKTSQIGANLVPNGPLSDLKMNIVALNAYTVTKDSVITSRLHQNLLGVLNDPILGKTTSSIYAQFLPELKNFRGFDGYTLDSVILSFTYSGTYFGDTLTEQTVKIYELQEGLDKSTKYYSNQNKTYNSLEIARHTFSLTSEVSGSKKRIKKGPINIKIDKNNSFIKKLWNIKKKDFFDTAADTVEVKKFFNYFNGLFITTELVNTSEEGALLGVNMLNSATSLTFYTTKDDNTKKHFKFIVIDGFCAWFNNYKHNNYQEAENLFKEQVLLGNKNLGKEKLYIQPLGGTHVHIDFPNLKDLNKLGNLIINKAELILNYKDVEEDKTSNFKNPVNLGIGVRHVNNSVSVIPDAYYDISYLGGKIDILKKEYRFRITKYVQEVLQNKDEGELGLYLFTANENITYNRLIFTGFDPADPELFSNRFRLEVTYSVMK